MAAAAALSGVSVLLVLICPVALSAAISCVHSLLSCCCRCSSSGLGVLLLVISLPSRWSVRMRGRRRRKKRRRNAIAFRLIRVFELLLLLFVAPAAVNFSQLCGTNRHYRRTHFGCCCCCVCCFLLYFLCVFVVFRCRSLIPSLLFRFDSAICVAAADATASRQRPCLPLLFAALPLFALFFPCSLSALFSQNRFA